MARVSRWMLAMAILGAGCSQPRLAPSFESGIPPERTMAATNAARTDDVSKVPQLITMLGSDDPAQRMIAADTLKRLTGQTHGYDFADPEPRRNQAIARWWAWYESGDRSASGSAS